LGWERLTLDSLRQALSNSGTSTDHMEY
jgi:hypothetical protein